MFGQSNVVMHMTDDKTHGACQRTTKIVLVSLTSLYSIVSFVLFIMSAGAWQKAYHRANNVASCMVGDPNCSLARWALYGFFTVAALIFSITSGLIAFRGICHRKLSPIDPVFVFRGMFFTLLIMAPLLFIGWTPSFAAPSMDDDFYARSVCPDGSDDCNASALPGSTKWIMPTSHSLAGLSGTFILESTDPFSKCGKSAMIMAHVQL
jgi:hypothetical protein